MALLEINSCQDAMIRRAIFWNFLASRLIKNAHFLELIHYDDLVEDTNSTMMAVRKASDHESVDLNLPSSTIRSKRSRLDAHEI